MGFAVATNIEKGRFYYDGEFGVREVTDIWPVSSRSGWLTYKHHSSKFQSESSNGRATILEFSEWAKYEVPPEELIGLLHSLDASEIDAAITDAQREFLCEAAKTWPLNFPLADLLVAKECERKGVVSLTGVILFEDGTYFRMVFTALGQALLKVL